MELDLIREVQWKWSRAHTWQKGDLLVLDNQVVLLDLLFFLRFLSFLTLFFFFKNQAVAHGRLGFLPSATRRVVVAITK